MTYWRMQLHPDAASEAMKHAVDSLAAGYIGLDFGSEVGDLRASTREQVQASEKSYFAFADEMAESDNVLIEVHHFPFALVTVDGEYNYIRTVAPELGVWFRHFRKVRDVAYYADYKTDARNWEQIPMTDAICPLRRADSNSRRLIDQWLQWLRSRQPHLAAAGD